MNSFHHLAEVIQEECRVYSIKMRNTVHKMFNCKWNIPVLVDDWVGNIFDVTAYFHFSGPNEGYDLYALGLVAV